MRVAIFGGSFDPIHSEHVRLVEAAQRALALDEVIVMPSYIAPHKSVGAAAGAEDRLAACRIALRGLPYARVSDYEIGQKGKSYTYLTCSAFAEKYPDAERFFLVGADMLENFFSWKEPDRILGCVTLAACGRGAENPERLRAAFRERFGKDFVTVPFAGEDVSSTRVRTELAFGKRPAALGEAVYRYCRERGLYTHPAILPALALEKEERREHSFRVALLATARCRALGIAEKQALLAAALHDCAKNVPLGSPLLLGFEPPADVPAPVLHQYAGAYLAEHAFGVTDGEILDAIRYHASGKEDMTPLGKLIYLADLVESSRDFEGVEELRSLFWEDLDACLCAALEHQIAYLEKGNRTVYPLTYRAYEWIKHR